jgi:hypothetical protein
MGNDIVAVLLYSACQCLVVFCLCLWLRHFLNAKQAEIERRAEEALRSWVEAPEGQASKLAEAISAMGAVVGSSAARSLRSSLQTDTSHVNTLANNTAGAIEGAANPLLSILAGGPRGKGAAVRQLAAILAPMFLKSQGSNGGDGQPPRPTSL